MRVSEQKPCDNPVVQRIESLMKDRGITQRQLMASLGLTVSVFTQWKYRNGRSYGKYIDKIADILGVSRDYLLTGREKAEPEISNREAQCLKLFRQVPIEIQDSTIELLRSIVSNQEKYL